MKICVVWDADVFGESSIGYVDLGPVASWRSSRALTVETCRVFSRDTEPLFVEALDFNLCNAFSIIKEREASFNPISSSLPSIEIVSSFFKSRKLA